MIELKSVRKIYRLDEGEIRALDGVNLKVQEGDLVVILGPSGCGKSTLLNIIGGIDRPTEGEVLIDGKDIAKFKSNELARHRRNNIGMIFQSFNLINDATLLENVSLPLKFMGFKESDQKIKSADLLKIVGMSERARSIPAKLSGGQQQRVSIARALAGEPRILLCDEPTGNLDSKTGEDIFNLLRELNREGHTVIIVTHNERYAKYADKVIEMLDGRIVAKKVGNSRSAEQKSIFKKLASKNISLVATLRLSLKNLSRRKLRVFLTSFGVTIGAMAIVILVSFGAGMQKSLNDQLKGMAQVGEIKVSGIKDSGSMNFQATPNFEKQEAKPMNDTTIEELKKINGVKAVFPSINLMGDIAYGDKKAQFMGESGSTIEYVTDSVKSKVKYGKFVSSDSANEVVLPYEIIKTLGFLKADDALGKEIVISNFMNLAALQGQASAGSFAAKEYKLKVVGIYDEKAQFSYSGYLPNLTGQKIIKELKAEEMMKKNPNIYDQLTVEPRDIKNVSEIKKVIEDKGYGVQTLEDAIKSMGKVFTVIQAILGVVGSIALIVASLGILNTMLMAILERTREIGIMKAVGARVKDIQRIFLAEALLIGLFGGLLGLGLGYLGTSSLQSILNFYANRSGAEDSFFKLYIPLYLSVGVVTFSAIVATIAGYLPARRASRMDPVRALKYE